MKKLTIAIIIAYCFISIFGVAQEVRLVQTLQHSKPAYAAQFSPDGKYVITASGYSDAKLWDPISGALIKEMGKLGGYAFPWAKDLKGTYVLGISEREPAVKICMVPSGIYYSIKTNHTDLHLFGGVQISPDYGYMVTYSQDRTAKVWEIKTEKMVSHFTKHTDVITSAEFSPDGNLIVTASADKTVKVWTITNDRLLLDLQHGGAVRYAQFSPDGKYIVTTEDKTVNIWDASTGALLRKLSGHTGVVYKARFSPDGQYVVSAASDDTAKIWVTSTGKLVTTIQGHTKLVYSAAFSLDGKYIVTASLDKTVKIWEVNLGIIGNAPRPSAPPNLEVNSISFSDMSGNGNNILDANEKASISFTLRNSGKGEAFNLNTKIRLLNTIQGIEYAKQQSINHLTGGDSTIVTIPVSGNVDVESGLAEFEVVVTESNGFDSDPIRISLNTQKLKTPQLVIADHKFSTAQGGKIKTLQPISLELILQNRGQGIAADVSVSFNNPPNVFQGSTNTINIARLAPNESKILKYEFFTNKMYTANEIPIDVVVAESYGKYGEKRTLSVSLEKTLAKTVALTVSGQADSLVQIDDVSLQISKSGAASAPGTKAEIKTAINSSGKPIFYSLIIGVEKYMNASAGLSNLNKPLIDARSLRNVLIDNYEFSEEHSIFLQNPLRVDIIRAFELLAKKITPKDNLLIFYAGHGYWDELIKVGYWLPSDAKADDKSDWISNSIIRDYIAGIQSKHTLLITDACFGGSIFKTRDVTTEMEVTAFVQKYKLPSRKAMTSGTLTTVPDESKFIQYLVGRLSDNTNEFLSATQLFYSLEIAVVNNTSTLPQFGVMQDTGDEGGDFIFIRKKE